MLTRQFRLPTYVNGNASGMLIEACAGLLDNDDPETAIAREAFEETGYEIRSARKVMQAYMSPGSVTEILHFFVAEYSRASASHEGGGVEEEDIEVMELPFDEALARHRLGRNPRRQDDHAAAIRSAEPVRMNRYAIIEAPSILGLKPTGVDRLPAVLLQHGLADELHARRAGRVEPKAAYDTERDPRR